MGTISICRFPHHACEIAFLEIVFFFTPFKAREIEHVINQAGQPRCFRGDDGEIRALLDRVRNPSLSQQFREHPDRGQRGFQFVRHIAHEIGLLTRER